MRVLILAILALISLPPEALARRHARPPKTPRAFRSGEILVKFRDGYTGASSLNAALARRGARLKKALKIRGLMRVGLTAGKSVADAVAEMRAEEGVEFAQPDFLYRKSAVPNDPQYGALWSLKNTGQAISSAFYSTNNPGIPGKDIGAESAWNLISDCSPVTVAVVDSGINYNHSDLAGNMWNGGSSYPKHGYDFVDNDGDPMDLNGHGTHVAGIIGARGNNGVGTTGVCWKASLMAVRVLDAAGSGYTSDIVDGVNFAVAQGAKVINLSLGQSSFDSALSAAISAASSQGAVVVAAAGNDGASNDSSPVYPCNDSAPNLVCVAALDQAFQLADFSNYGSASVDVGAPGVNIQSLTNGRLFTVSDSFGGWTASGSSGWGSGTRTFSSGASYPMLMNPPNWNRSTARYANSTDARVHKSFNLAGADAATLEFYAFVDTQASDYFSVAYRAGAVGDPFPSGTQIERTSGSTDGSAEYFGYDLGGCRASSCTIGFRLNSNASGTSYGVGVVDFTVSALTLADDQYENLTGTSMAAPMVSGLAALLFAYHPSYTAADVVAAIKNGGTSSSSLAGKTVTGKAVSASGSLSYIAPPSGLALVAR